MPGEVSATTAENVHSTVGARLVPESAGVKHCAVVVEARVMAPRVIVTVVRGEHHTV